VGGLAVGSTLPPTKNSKKIFKNSKKILEKNFILKNFLDRVYLKPKNTGGTALSIVYFKYSNNFKFL